ncbi:MAG: hypothetical protein GAK41_01410 [Burkholderia gladioli]|nr:MAG: hypothetical protein GAK41_01410 [Burkholderia gladioli]
MRIMAVAAGEQRRGGKRRTHGNEMANRKKPDESGGLTAHDDPKDKKGIRERMSVECQFHDSAQ